MIIKHQNCRGEVGAWIAFVVVILRLFFPRHFPGIISYLIFYLSLLPLANYHYVLHFSSLLCPVKRIFCLYSTTKKHVLIFHLRNKPLNCYINHAMSTWCLANMYLSMVYRRKNALDTLKKNALYHVFVHGL